MYPFPTVWKIKIFINYSPQCALFIQFSSKHGK